MRNAKLKLFASIIGVMSLFSFAVAGCVSPTALAVEISSPEDGAVVSESPITVTGMVSGYPRGEVAVGEETGRLVPEVTVNGVKTAVAEDGTFSAQVELTEGENTIEVVAMMNDVEARDSITVIYASSALELTSIAVEPTSPDNLAVGATLQFAAVGTYSDGSTADITSQVTWASSDEAIATIDATGLATGVAVGSTNITASLSGIDSPAIPLTVVEAAPALSLEITSPEDGAELTESPVAVTGTVSDAEAMVVVNSVVVEVASDGTFSVQVVLAEGQNTITTAAILGQGQVRAEDSITVTFAPAPALSLEITSPEDGAELTESPVAVTGTVSDPAAAVTVNGVEATVDEFGSFSANVEMAEGENVITAVATMGEMQAEDSITVIYAPSALELTSIAVEPTSPDNLAVGATLQFAAVGTYSDGSTADITSQVTWASSDEAIATIDATGLATGVAVGSTNITASLSGIDSPAVALIVVTI